MLTPEENDLLCRVEGEAPMGRMMRRYWIAACLIEEVPDPDGDPVRVRLFGEDLVAFRDSEGRVGLIEEACPHRRASLFYGRNEECGLRCLYHGWKFDVNGNCVDMPSEPPGTGFDGKVKIKSYPTQEWGGFVWTYMGPRETMPAFAPPHFAPTATTNVAIFKAVINANWAQGLEGAIDSAHSSSLHSTDMPPSAAVSGSTSTGQAWQRPSTDKSPRLYTQATNYGFQYAAVRRPIRGAEDNDYVRITHFIAPHHVAIPPNNVYNVAQMNVPIDDHHHNLYIMAWSETGGVSTEAWRRFTGMQLGIDLDRLYRKVHGKAENYGQDRKAMRLGNFTGIRGFPNQDIAMWESMEPIAERWRERLGASDLAIVEFRRRMVEAVKAFQNGAQPPHLTPAQYASVRAFEGIVPKSTDWRTLGGANSASSVAAQ